MELKATQVGRHLARHPYTKATLLNAGIEVCGEQHNTIIPFIQLLAIHCKQGIIWGELEFELPQNKVIRLHGTEWHLTQAFYQKLNTAWSEWSQEMSQIAASLLQGVVDDIKLFLEHKKFIKDADLNVIKDKINQTFKSLPLLTQRLPEFAHCLDNYQYCLDWLTNGDIQVKQINQQWVNQCLSKSQHFFDHIEQQPLNLAQRKAAISNRQASLVLAGAGCGKTSVLIARVGWLLHSQQATPEQILLLAFSRKTADEMRTRLAKQLPNVNIAVKTFHALALDIIQTCNSKKTIQISPYATDSALRYDFLSANIQKLCQEKKSYANGWRNWLVEEFGWELGEIPFWQDPQIMARLMVRIDHWLAILRSLTVSSADIIASAPTEIKATLQKRVRLLTPLLKIWKSELKQQQALDFNGLISQAINLLEKGKFNSPWQHILIDEFQDISPTRMTLVNSLCKHASATPSLFAVGDDWQAIYRFSGAELTLTTLFNTMFTDVEQFFLEKTYRFGQELAEISNDFILQNPNQISKKVYSDINGKTPIIILPEQQLENLLNKLSGFVKPQEKVLILARYHYLRPELLTIAAKRWPKLPIEFMTIHNSKGYQADYVIIVGLANGKDGFPAEDRGSLLESVLLPQDDYLDAEERRLLYVALTRTKNRVWLLQNRDNPSVFVKQLQQLGAAVKRQA